MKICIVGAGAIGGMIGVRLAQAGHDVSFIARGPHLKAIRENGLRLIMEGERYLAKGVHTTDNLAEIAEQDVVFLALKAHQIAPIANDLSAMLGPDTTLVTLQNGIPWWYFQKLGGKYEGQIVNTVDPDGAIAKSIDPDRIVGCIAYPAAEIAEPGVIRHIEGVRFPVGEIDGTETERVTTIANALVDAGFKSPVLPDIRSEIWLKLWGNLTFNPISSMTHATLEDICQYPLTRELAANMMSEAQTIGEKLGAGFRVPLQKRIEGAEKVGKHKTSMLQDVEAGRPMEIDGMLGVVVELGEMTETPTPTLKALYACASLLNKTIQGEQIRIRGERLA
jgi:2-dehydropantoate 2-reductase